MNDLLAEVIESLDFSAGELYDATLEPIPQNKNQWLDNGDWLKSSAQAGVSKVFFVQNNPTVVFARCGNTVRDRISAFNNIWCISGPRILFLESDGEISVIDMAQEPVRFSEHENEEQREFEVLAKLTSANNELKRFHRENIESGRIFSGPGFKTVDKRADHALISDLQIVRKQLFDCGLSLPCTHSLIGRSIFIRYLEDRKILTDDYYRKIAQQNQIWKMLFDNPAAEENTDFSNNSSKYCRILQDKEFTYALFRSLSNDFNGDMFPNIDDEENEVRNEHLDLLRNLLYGNTEHALFFFSYRFDIIPLSLISAIYEAFYQSESIQKKTEKSGKSKAQQEGAFYTPLALVEFVLSRSLTSEIIKQTPRILDPACGSGIFLVEAFRRIVRYQYGNGNDLSFDDLVKIIKEQIVGIEINGDAAQITAFSLYIALLNYLDPPSIQVQIQEGKRLPHLINDGTKSENHFNMIFVANAFSLNKETIGHIDVVVGNPPWGSPGRGIPVNIKNQIEDTLSWCQRNGYTIGDKDPSQAFLLFAQDIVAHGGCCAMLTSAGSLLNTGKNSVSFRKMFMKNVRLKEIFNFSHVRKFFFHDAVSPFLMIHFEKNSQNDSPVKYWSPKQIKSIENTQAVFLSIYDRAFLLHQDLTDNKTWKINWFGRYADEAFILQLKELSKLGDFIDRSNSGQGYKISPAENDFPADIQKLPSLIIRKFTRYSDLSFKNTPPKYNCHGNFSVYFGPRLLVKRGISSKTSEYIVAQYRNNDFCFTNSINGFKLKNNNEKLYLLVLGILWSSFPKYYFFNTSAQWGCWHDEIYLDAELLQLPIPNLDDEQKDKQKKERVVSIVKNLREYKPEEHDLFHSHDVPAKTSDSQRRKWENDLDEAVFELYGFSEKQRILIRDFCNVSIPFFYKPDTSIGAKPVIENNDTEWIGNYAKCFADYWKAYLDAEDELRADVCTALSGNVIGIEFYIADKGDAWDLLPKERKWQSILAEIGKNLSRPFGSSAILLDGQMSYISDNSIIIIKRNEKRLWTKSLAYEDAESTLTKRLLHSNTQTRGVN
ncbi:MAG: SAM-dependent methyltransferase [Dysgonamonadaceae bacterium]|jgi:type I restriction-modification system DNA methylase subunit|nr:SAM-dependent methyltransferase [Dysgonamonadaceae bacterium]